MHQFFEVTMNVSFITMEAPDAVNQVSSLLIKL